MTQWVGSSQMIAAARAQLPSLCHERDRLFALQQQHHKDLADLQRHLAGAWEYLATVLVPGLVPEHLNWAAGLLSLPPIGAAAVQADVDRDRAGFQREVGTIEQDPSYVGAEGILNEASIRIVELTEAMAPLQQSLGAFEAQPQWFELLETGYGTEAYSGKWYSMSYYRHWKYGDLAVEVLGPGLGVEDFGALLQRFLDEREALRQLRSTCQEWTIKRDHVQGLQGRRAQVGERLANLEQRHLGLVRGGVHAHLSALTTEQLVEMVSSFEPAVVAVKRIEGITAKAQYLHQTHARWVEEPLAKILKAVRKNERDVVKLARPKHQHRRFAHADYENRFRDRTGSWHKRHTKYSTARSRILEFDDYARYDHSTDVVWWSLMTDDSVKARFIPEVSEYYGRTTRPAARHDEAVAALAGEQASADEGWDDMS